MAKEEDEELFAFNREDAARILEVAASFRLHAEGEIGPNDQLCIVIGKTVSTIAASAADSGGTVQLYEGEVIIHAVNSARQRYATTGKIKALNLAPTGEVAAGALVIAVRESYSNRWFIVWELCA